MCAGAGCCGSCGRIGADSVLTCGSAAIPGINLTEARGCAAEDGPPAETPPPRPAGGGMGTGRLDTVVVCTSPPGLTPMGETMVVRPPRVGAVLLGTVVRADMWPWAPIVWIPCGVWTMVCIPVGFS